MCSIPYRAYCVWLCRHKYSEYIRTPPTHAVQFALYAIFPRQREKGLKSAYGWANTPTTAHTHRLSSRTLMLGLSCRSFRSNPLMPRLLVSPNHLHHPLSVLNRLGGHYYFAFQLFFYILFLASLLLLLPPPRFL